MNFENKLASNQKKLKELAFRLTGCKHAADDLVQDTFLLALQNKDKYKEDTNLGGWLATILRNTFINSCQRAGRLKISQKRAPHTDDVVQNEFTLLEDANRVENAVLMLPGVLFSAIDMRADGKAYAEIATATGEPIGTVKSRIHNARKMLREIL